MTTIISLKGRNTRMGKLFKTPKYNLLYKGRPALEQTVEYMSQFGEVKVMTHENSQPDTGIVDMLLQMDLPDKFFVVDCDVIPIRLNPPQGATVYCFENKDGLSCYSNYDVRPDGMVTQCNEKQEVFKYSGAGIYYFDNAKQFKGACFDGFKTLAQVMEKLLKTGVRADTTSEIFRFGSLQTILNNDVSKLGV